MNISWNELVSFSWMRGGRPGDRMVTVADAVAFFMTLSSEERSSAFIQLRRPIRIRAGQAADLEWREPELEMLAAMQG